MDDVESRTSSWIELRVIHSAATTHDAWMVVTSDAHTINFPVHLQLGTSLTAVVGSDNIPLREGKLFVHDSGSAPRAAKTAKKPSSYGLVHYVPTTGAEGEAQEQFHVKLYMPSDKYRAIWELCAQNHLPRRISLQVKGLHGDAQWDVAETGKMLLVEDFSISFPIV
jgi:hypothetical protein